MPELNEERRKELCKQVRKQIEEGKVAVRAIRRDAMEAIKKMKKDSVITEDEQKTAENELQKVTDSHVKELDTHRRRQGKGDHGRLTRNSGSGFIPSLRSCGVAFPSALRAGTTADERNPSLRAAFRLPLCSRPIPKAGEASCSPKSSSA